MCACKLHREARKSLKGLCGFKTSTLAHQRTESGIKERRTRPSRAEGVQSVSICCLYHHTPLNTSTLLLHHPTGVNAQISLLSSSLHTQHGANQQLMAIRPPCLGPSMSLLLSLPLPNNLEPWLQEAWWKYWSVLFQRHFNLQEKKLQEHYSKERQLHFILPCEWFMKPLKVIVPMNNP